MIDRSYKNGTKIVLQLKEIENQERWILRKF